MQQEVKLNIRVSRHISHGIFRPDPLLPGGWIASKQTYAAMKKDIFSIEGNLDVVLSPYQCHSCKTNLDRQFWHFCPYCGTQFLA